MYTILKKKNSEILKIKNLKFHISILIFTLENIRYLVLT